MNYTVISAYSESPCETIHTAAVKKAAGNYEIFQAVDLLRVALQIHFPQKTKYYPGQRIWQTHCRGDCSST